MLWLTRKMTTRGCVWRSGSLTVEIATFPLAAVAVAVIAAEIAPTSAVPRTPNSSSTCHPEQSEGPALDRVTTLPARNCAALDSLEYTCAEFQAKHKQGAQ